MVNVLHTPVLHTPVLHVHVPVRYRTHSIKALLFGCFIYLQQRVCFDQVSLLSEKDELSWTKNQLLAQIDVALGGRVAEELIIGADNITTGMYVHVYFCWYANSCNIIMSHM